MPLSARVASPNGRERPAAPRDGRLGALISSLDEIQAEHGYLPEEALRALSRRTGRPLVEVYGVATFYKGFRLEPRGRHLITVCLGTACHIRSGPAVAGEFERRLGIRAGGTTPDGEFTLQTVNCLGACAIGPIVTVDGRYFRKVDTAKVGEILAHARNGRARARKPVRKKANGGN